MWYIYCSGSSSSSILQFTSLRCVATFVFWFMGWQKTITSGGGHLKPTSGSAQQQWLWLHHTTHTALQLCCAIPHHGYNRGLLYPCTTLSCVGWFGSKNRICWVLVNNGNAIKWVGGTISIISNYWPFQFRSKFARIRERQSSWQTTGWLSAKYLRGDVTEQRH